MKKEIVIFLAIFIILSLVQHPDFLTSPVDRIVHLPNAGAYGLGMVHPIVFTLVFYIIILIVRLVIKSFKKIFSKKEN